MRGCVKRIASLTRSRRSRRGRRFAHPPRDRANSSRLPHELPRSHCQFLAYDLAVPADDHRQLAVTIEEGQAMLALVLANSALDAPSDGTTLHLPDKILDGEFHCARSQPRIDFRHAIYPTNR